MITVSVQRDRDGCVKGFSVVGHANFAERGRDIVCAGVSAVVQTAILGLQEFVGIDVAGSQKEGFLVCNLPPLTPAMRHQADAILETMLIGLTAIASSYTGYVQIEDPKEV